MFVVCFLLFMVDHPIVVDGFCCLLLFVVVCCSLFMVCSC